MISFSLADYVHSIGQLPLPNPDYLDSPNKKYLFQSLQFRYQSISCWLKTLVLAEDLRPEAIETDMQYYQASAEASKALLDLVIAVHPRTGHPDIRAFPNPGCLWYWLEVMRSIQLVHIQGLTGTPKIRGRKAAHKRFMEGFNTIQDQVRNSSSTETVSDSTTQINAPLNLENLEHPESYWELITWLEARTIAIGDPSFDKEHFSKYMKELKRCMTKIKNTKEIPPAWVDEYGDLVVGGIKGQPLPGTMGKPRLNVKKCK